MTNEQKLPKSNMSALNKLRQWLSVRFKHAQASSYVVANPNSNFFAKVAPTNNSYHSSSFKTSNTGVNEEYLNEDGVLTLLRNLSKGTFNYVNPNKAKKAQLVTPQINKPAAVSSTVPNLSVATKRNDLWLETEKLLKAGSWQYEIETKKFFCTANTFNLLTIPDQTEVTDFFSLLPFFSTDDRESIAECWEKALLLNKEMKTVARLNNSIEPVWVKIKFKPINEGNKLVKLVGTFEDVTSGITKQNVLFQEKKKTEAITETKTAFMSLYSHEIRTPLNSIMGFTYLLLQETSLPAKIKKYLNSIHFSAQHLLYLSKNTLDHSKIEAGRLELEVVNFKLRELLDNLYHSFNARAIDKQIKFELIVDSCIPEEVAGDPSRLTQVLNNLVGNAIKFTKDGGVKLIVDVIYQSDNDWVLDFSVEDSGIGIPEESQQIIFESYVQANSSTHRRFGGTGLGLTITKKIVELHKGEIKLKSTPGVGSVFTVRLKYTKANPALTPVPVKSLNKTSDLTGLKVLVIDDDEINNLVTSELLLKWGALVDTAENGQLALWKIDSNHYDLILMDLYMPTMDGFDTIAHIREAGNNVPVIALTGTANQEEICRLLTMGVNNYLIKPFHPEQLYTTLTKLTQEVKV